MPDREFNIEPLLELQGMSRKDAMDRLEATAKDFDSGHSYEGLKKLHLLESENTDPIEVYFSGDKFALGYVEGPSLADGNKRELLAALGEPADKLASRAGKGSTIYVYPEKGLAFSAKGQELEFLEVFPPTTLAKYKKDIDREPPDFVK